MKKRALTVCLLGLWLVSLVTGAALAENRLERILAEGTLTIATSPDYAPYEFIDPGKQGQEAIVGAEMAMARYIAEKLGVALLIETMDFDRTEAAVMAGDVDMAIAAYEGTAARAEQMALSDLGYLDVETKDHVILVHRDRAPALSGAQAFTGGQIAVQADSTAAFLLDTQLPGATAHIILELEDGVAKVLAGDVDGLGVSGPVGKLLTAQYPELAVSDFRYDYTQVGTVILLQKGQTELLEAVNGILADIHEKELVIGWYEEAAALAISLGLMDGLE